MKKPSSDIFQLLLFGEARPDGNGKFVFTPRHPVAEITAKQAAKLLSISPQMVNKLVNQPEAAKILVWRWSSERRGKRLFDSASVIAYREATKDPEFGIISAPAGKSVSPEDFRKK